MPGRRPGPDTAAAAAAQRGLPLAYPVVTMLRAAVLLLPIVAVRALAQAPVRPLPTAIVHSAGLATALTSPLATPGTDAAQSAGSGSELTVSKGGDVIGDTSITGVKGTTAAACCAACAALDNCIAFTLHRRPDHAS